MLQMSKVAAVCNTIAVQSYSSSATLHSCTLCTRTAVQLHALSNCPDANIAAGPNIMPLSSCTFNISLHAMPLLSLLQYKHISHSIFHILPGYLAILTIYLQVMTFSSCTFKPLFIFACSTLIILFSTLYILFSANFNILIHTWSLSSLT